jgi:phospholipid/cholesterol/gamma-HCH transport system substrate-binding protein
MASVKTKFSVGLFLICGLAVVVFAVIWLGMSNYLEKGRYFAAYFDESVQGLDKDSPVKYRGVRIGRVNHIGVAPDGKLIEVILKIETDFRPNHNRDSIVAQLKSVGITGLMFIELEQKGAKIVDVMPPFSFEPSHTVIPTRTSEISKLFKGIEDIIELFRALDADEISKQLTGALTKINKAIDQAQIVSLASDVHAAVRNIQQMVQPKPFNRMLSAIGQAAEGVNQMADNADGGIGEIRRTVSHLDGVITTSGQDMNQMTADLKSAAGEIKNTVQAATVLLSHTDQKVDNLQYQMMATLNRIELATDTLNRFLTQMTTQPSQLVFSGPQADKPSPP